MFRMMGGKMATIEIRPQPRQEAFLSSPADVCIYGGAAGGGKTWALIYDFLKHYRNPGFGSVLFRRTLPEHKRQGGPWDESMGMYPLFGAVPNTSSLQWKFPSGSKITFAGLQYETDVMSWKSAQIPAILFDQLEMFTQYQFMYMASRNRSVCGVKPYIRATCNPEPGWLADFLAWWIAEDGYADLSRAGKIRYFVVSNDTFVWADDPEELKEQFPKLIPRSCTFIPATIYDNKILLEADPGYLANLMGQSLVERERLLGDAERGGNWKIKPEAGNVFNRKWFPIVSDWEKNKNWSWVIRWDFATTEKSVTNEDPDYTAHCVMGRDPKSGEVLILEGGQKRLNPAGVYNHFVSTCEFWRDYLAQFGYTLKVRWEIEPGSASTREARTFAQLVPWADARGIRSTGSKLERARPLAAQAEHGFVSVVNGEWVEMWLNHMHSQPADHDDMMDAATGAYSDLVGEVVKKARSYGG